LGDGGLRGFGTSQRVRRRSDHRDRDTGPWTIDTPFSRPVEPSSMTVAADAREAVDAHPFLHTALRAGVLNYTAAADFLDVGDTDAVAAALRRYAGELDEYDRPERRVSVSMRSNVGLADDGDGVLRVGGDVFAVDAGDLTAVVATGEVDTRALATVLARLRTAEIEAVAAAGTDGHLAVVVGRRAAPDAVRAVESALGDWQATH